MDRTTGLEEGYAKNPLRQWKTFKELYCKWLYYDAFENVYVKGYIVWGMLLWVVVLLSLVVNGEGPAAATTAATAPPPPDETAIAEHARLYVNVKSAEVVLESRDSYAHAHAVAARLLRAMQRGNHTCLAAVHLGQPLRIFTIADSPADKVFINPVLLSTGNILSKALESSPFYPDAEPVKMKRYIPVAIRNGSDDAGQRHTYEDAARAHCVLAMLEQLDGENRQQNNAL